MGGLCGDVDKAGGVEATFHMEGEPLVVGWGWNCGDAAGEVEEARAGCVGAPFFDVGDGFIRGCSEVGVAVAAFSEKVEDVEVFGALGEAVGLAFGVVEELGRVVGL